MGTHSHAEPLAPSQRAELLEALRGFALFGVLASNLVGFSGSLQVHGDPSIAARVPLLSIVMFVAQVAWSKAWLSAFRFGPFEWLWRSMTYGGAQPMRRIPATA